MTTTRPETDPMLLVDCPLCDAPVPFETASGVIECETCGIRLETAEDLQPLLAAA